MGSMLTAHYSLDGVWAKASSSDGSVRILMNLPLSEDTLRSTINDLGIYTLMKAEFQRWRKVPTAQCCRDFSLFQHDLELAAGGGINEDAKLVTVGGCAAEVVAQALARVGRAER